MPLDPANGSSSATPAEKARRCLDNLTIIAEAAGASSRTRSGRRLRHRLSVFAEMNEAYASYFPSDPPARTTIGVAALPMGAEVEMDAVIAL